MSQITELTTRSSFRIQCDVIRALFARELKTRFGAFRLGYIWAFLEPVGLIAIHTIVIGGRVTAKGQTLLAGIQPELFFLTSIIPFFLFRNIVHLVMSSVQANSQLFIYRHVKPLDAMVARLLLECITYSIVYFILIAGAWYLGYDIQIYDPLGLIVVYVIFIFFSFGLGVMACVANQLYSDTSKIVHILMYPLYFISGIFFALVKLPPEWQPWLLWNPIVHFEEIQRSKIFVQYPVSPKVSIFYLLAITGIICFIAISLYRSKRIEMVTS